MADIANFILATVAIGPPRLDLQLAYASNRTGHSHLLEVAPKQTSESTSTRMMYGKNALGSRTRTAAHPPHINLTSSPNSAVRVATPKKPSNQINYAPDPV